MTALTNAYKQTRAELVQLSSSLVGIDLNGLADAAQINNDLFELREMVHDFDSPESDGLPPYSSLSFMPFHGLIIVPS